MSHPLPYATEPARLTRGVVQGWLTGVVALIRNKRWYGVGANSTNNFTKTSRVGGLCLGINTFLLMEILHKITWRNPNPDLVELFRDRVWDLFFTLDRLYLNVSSNDHVSIFVPVKLITVVDTQKFQPIFSSADKKLDKFTKAVGWAP